MPRVSNRGLARSSVNLGTFHNQIQAREDGTPTVQAGGYLGKSAVVAASAVK